MSNEIINEKFSELGLSSGVLSAVREAGYENPTPIQLKSIPHLLEGKDILGIAQTGTGKTAGFTLPMIEILAAGRARARMPRSLILEPTRELAAQVAENFSTYGKNHKLTMALLIGGVSFVEQNEKLDRGVDVLIATPGRLLDQFERGRILLADIKLLVVDEADRMLDMGFIPDIEKIMNLLPYIRQTAMFSATMPSEVQRLADSYMVNPIKIEVAPQKIAAETVTQKLYIIDGGKLEKQNTLLHLIKKENVKNAIVFCNRKRDVRTVDQALRKNGLNAQALHGDLPQSVRTGTLEKFRLGKINVLVASDVAARGLDIDEMSHVFNYDVPTNADDYIHRIGRTGRAGKEGHAITLVTSDDEKYVQQIEQNIGHKLNKEKIDNKHKIINSRKNQSKSLKVEQKGKNKTNKPQKKTNEKKKRNIEENKKNTIGMGDHIPAFLQK
ncbi:MAG: DEAD/DEAH box helicase [Alphaproteobacteria bacterium]|nr:DEAD/DEAH box helicase [Alphaproteobacteria bacterium]|tara:strand:+ start:500 stop:1825 length:1326 start_codon:yes stop_codon:yes gene_type:complete